MAMRTVISAIFLAILFAVGCGSDEDGTAKEDTGTQAAASESGCTEADSPGTKKVKSRKAPKEKLDPDKSYVVKVVTNCGEFEITLDQNTAPKTDASFVALIREGFYDGLGFHRIADGFVIQGGDPLGNGGGGPGYTVRERPPRDTKYVRGTVAMAKAGTDPPGTSGSQFFVVTASDSELPPEYAVVGKVTRGFETVKKIEALGTPGSDGPPTQPIVMEKVTVSSD